MIENQTMQIHVMARSASSFTGLFDLFSRALLSESFAKFAPSHFPSFIILFGRPFPLFLVQLFCCVKLNASHMIALPSASRVRCSIVAQHESHFGTLVIDAHVALRTEKDAVVHPANRS